MSAAATVSGPRVRALLEQSAAQLQDSDSALLDVQLLLARALGKSRSWLYAWPEAELEPAAVERFSALLEARRAGTPVAYLLGQREFWSLDLEVTPAVLIPRPETEVLVEAALELGPAGAACVADLGTGSGAIALALAKERPQWQLHATDSSTAALAVAQRNAERLGLARVQFLAGSWCEPLPPQPFDLVVSNPPYLAPDDEHLQQGDLRFEPRSALVAAEDGLQDIRLVATQALPRLKPGGWLLVEHGLEQGAAVRRLFAAAGYTQIETRKDGAGRERLSLGARP
jgi:release factor glutamine methyltransferase